MCIFGDGYKNFESAAAVYVEIPVEGANPFFHIGNADSVLSQAVIVLLMTSQSCGSGSVVPYLDLVHGRMLQNGNGGF